MRKGVKFFRLKLVSHFESYSFSLKYHINIKNNNNKLFVDRESG